MDITRVMKYILWVLCWL